MRFHNLMQFYSRGEVREENANDLPAASVHHTELWGRSRTAVFRMVVFIAFFQSNTLWWLRYKHQLCLTQRRLENYL